jgi:hypothetical protein
MGLMITTHSLAPTVTFDDMSQRFSNQRQWREFLSAVQCSVDYSAVINTVRAGTKYFYDGLVRVSGLSAKR